MSRQVVPVVLILLAVALSGCAGGEGAPQETDEPPVELETGEVVRADAGIVHGTVRSDAGLLVERARVFLVGTVFDHTTDAAAEFRFVNVTAGLQNLRVEADGFRVYEKQLEVVAQEIHEVNVTMLPRDDRGPGYQPHIHDFWRGKDQVTIMDEEVDIREQRVGTVTADQSYYTNYAAAAVLYANLELPKYLIPLPEDSDVPALVYPGTGEIQVTFTWNDAPPMPPEYAFGYEPANDNDEVILDPQGSGETWTVAVEPEMTDSGHQLFSLWEFYIIPSNDARSAPDYRPALVTESIHVTITIVKSADPPAEPPHPEFWKNGDVLVLRDHDDGEWRSTGSAALGSHPSFTTARIVPPATERLHVEFKWSYDRPESTPADPEYVLYYNSAQYNPNARPKAAWDRIEPVEEGDGKARFEIDLDKADTDAFYQTKSAWRYAPRPADMDNPDDLHHTQYRPREFTMAVTAFREPGAEVL